MLAAMAHYLMFGLQASFFKIKDVSDQHAGHQPSFATEVSHVSLVIVSDSFEGVLLVKRHQMVYHQLDPFLKKGLHAVQMSVYTPSEWESICKS